MALILFLAGCGDDDETADVASGPTGPSGTTDEIGLVASEWVQAIKAGDEEAACDLEKPDDVIESGCPDYNDKDYDPVRSAPDEPTKLDGTDAFFDLSDGRTLIVDLDDEDGGIYVIEWDLRGKASAEDKEAAPEREPASGTDCGPNPQGAQVVINAGSLSCDEAITVSEKWGQAGYAEWQCGDQGETVEGDTVPVDVGYSCTGPDGARISVIEGTASPEAAGSGGDAGGGGGTGCGPGEVLNRTTGECVAAETGEAPGGDPYANPP